MKLKILLLSILITCICVCCSKENGQKGIITIEGITECNNVGEIIGNIDTTDWRFTDTWSSTEQKLFRIHNSNNTVTEGTRPDSSVVILGYPNPATTLMFFTFHLNPNMYYDARIVDNKLNIKLQFDSVKYSYFDIKDSAYLKNELYRLYYKVYSENKVYRGHGDFKFIN